MQKNIKATVGVDNINEVGDWVEGLEEVTSDDTGQNILPLLELYGIETVYTE